MGDRNEALLPLFKEVSVEPTRETNLEFFPPQSKIICPTKNQEDLKLNGKRQPIHTKTEMTEMLQLSLKEFEGAIIDYFQ